MATVDFTNWVAPDLRIPLGGKTYVVNPPSVAQATQILACAAHAEHVLGIATTPIGDDLTAVIERINDTPLPVLTLGQDVHDAMIADGVAALTITRAAYYAMFFWARGEERATGIAELLWRDTDMDGGEDPGEAPGR